jgi:hypothetical protein
MNALEAHVTYTESAVLETKLCQPQSPLPAWHTACVLALLAGLVALSTLSRHATPSGGAHHRIAGYFVVLCSEWLITAFIAWGCRFHQIPFRRLLGDFSPRLATILRDCALAVGFLILANIVLGIAGAILRPETNASLRNLLPRGPAEIAAFFLLTLTAGFCEEVIYRGYLGPQFAAWTRSAIVGLFLQAILFGVSHLYQGWKMVISITIYGCLFGALALWRRSLRPGMIAHFLQDAIGGLVLARYALK